MVGILKLKCPDCTAELEKTMPMFYRCSKCKTVFFIMNQQQIEESGKEILELPEKYRDESVKFYDKLAKKDSI